MTTPSPGDGEVAGPTPAPGVPVRRVRHVGVRLVVGVVGRAVRLGGVDLRLAQTLALAALGPALGADDAVAGRRDTDLLVQVAVRAAAAAARLEAVTEGEVERVHA